MEWALLNEGDIMKQFQITLPEEKSTDVMDYLEKRAKIRNIAKFHVGTGFMLLFRVSDAKTQEILTELEKLGVGVDYGIIDILQIEASKPILEEDVRITPTERLSVEEIYSKVAGGTRLSFDFLALLVISCIIAAIGLATNSVVIIVASMLLAPLMGPILGLSLGTVIQDRRLVATGIKNEIIGLAIALVMGLLMGAFITPWSRIILMGDPWPTFEMVSRGILLNLFVGVAVAAASGIGVGIAITRGEISGLVGVAIAASLMPPCVNAGMNLTYALIGPAFFVDVSVLFHLQIGLISFALTIINIVIINSFAILAFILRRLSPIKSKSRVWRDLPQLSSKRREALWHRR
jgi:uncharacterized hydrophobic protein (TIGR00341 family)